MLDWLGLLEFMHATEGENIHIRIHHTHQIHRRSKYDVALNYSEHYLALHLKLYNLIEDRYKIRSGCRERTKIGNRVFFNSMTGLRSTGQSTDMHKLGSVDCPVD